MSPLADLSHVSRRLKGGGEILILNIGAVIGPEAQAMLGALYSRSSEGIRQHLRVLIEKGYEKFMETYYVGYGHKSIGDLGGAAVFIDGVSMLAAKAIQEFPLYNGQESSTRYIDFSHQRFENPLGSSESEEVLEEWRRFHIGGFETLVPSLKERFPRKEDESEGKYEKAVAARAFDIMRGFLPIGATTNVCWVGELRQFADRLRELRNFCVPEVVEIGSELTDALLEAFPHSFRKKLDKENPAELEAYLRHEARERYYQQLGWSYYRDFYGFPEFELSHNGLDLELLREYEWELSHREPKTELPWSIRECGQMRFRFLLDFGSYRDLQRQRALIIPVPLVTDRYGFEEWYISELPSELQTKARRLIERQLATIREFRCSREMRQYYFPMGMRCPIRMTGDIRGLTYFVELRVSRFVHHTLVVRASQCAETIEASAREMGLKSPIVLHLDKEPGRFDVERGSHDIVKKA